MAILDAAALVGAALQTAGVGVVGTTIFVGPAHPDGTGIPVAALFVLPSGGVAPSPYLGTGTDWHEPSLQVYVRSAVNDYAGGLAKARAVVAALQRATPTGCTLCLVGQTEPVYLGRDGQGSHEFVVNVRVGFDA